MNKIIVFFLAGFLFINNLSGQVFNSGTNFKGNVFSLGIEPTVYGSKNFKLFLHGDLKLTPGAKLFVVTGLRGDEYIGGGFKWGLAKIIALNLGLHQYQNTVGLDGSVIFSIPVSDAHIVTGIDSNTDFDKKKPFKDKKPRTPVWVPVGLEVAVSDALSIMLEGEIPLNNDAFTIFGGGLIIFI